MQWQVVVNVSQVRAGSTVNQETRHRECPTEQLWATVMEAFQTAMVALVVFRWNGETTHIRADLSINPVRQED